MPDVHTDGRYEWTAELDEGVNLADGSPWRGHRVRYRPLELGGRWRSFLLSVEGDTLPSSEMILRAIDEHASVNPFSR